MTDTLLAIYATAELGLALWISLSNFVVIFVYLRSRHIRTPTNVYIFSLAIADFLTGALGIPLTVASVLTRWPYSFYPCLAIHLILCVLCTVSTFHLLGMAVDKYLTICLKRFRTEHSYTSAQLRKSRANILIICAWLFGIGIAGLPLVDGFGFASKTAASFRAECHFTLVVDYRYLVFVIFFATIILPSGVIALCYIAIYSHIRSEERQIKCLLRASERQRRINARRKLIRILLILVLSYAICWYPLYMINTADLFLPDQFHASPALTLAAVVLSHLNCALNPLIYAYGMPGFKYSLRRFLPLRNIGPPAGTGLVSNQKMPYGMRMGPRHSSVVAVGGYSNPMLLGQQLDQRRFSRASNLNAGMLYPKDMLMVSQPSTKSLVENRREQFRKQHDYYCRNNKAEGVGRGQPFALSNSSSDEMERRRSSEEEEGGAKEKSGNGPSKGAGLNISTDSTSSGRSSRSSCEDKASKRVTVDGEKSAIAAAERGQPSAELGAMSSLEGGILGQVNLWTVRILNGGHWLVRSRGRKEAAKITTKIALEDEGTAAPPRRKCNTLLVPAG